MQSFCIFSVELQRSSEMHSEHQLSVLRSATRVMAVDNSGSTSGCQQYWSRVKDTYNKFKPELVLLWNSYARIVTDLKGVRSEGGTDPVTFVQLLKEKTNSYELVVTTDGEIDNRSIDACDEILKADKMALINSVQIYYFGKEAHMNIGLNVIFEGTSNFTYTINDQMPESPIEHFDELTLNDIQSTNFHVSLIGRIRSTQTRFTGDDKSRDEALGKLKGEVSRLFSKLEAHTLCDIDSELRSCFANDKRKEFLDLLRADQLDVSNVQKEKSKALNYFNAASLNLADIRMAAAQTISAQNIDVPIEPATEWTQFEDPITMEQFHLPGLLIQSITDTANTLIDNNTLLKHPLKLLSNEPLTKEIMKLVEHQPIDYATYIKINNDRDPRSTISSPYTRATCSGLFLFDVDSMVAVKNNCRVISQFFGPSKKVPGDLRIWNLVFMYLLYKHRFADTEYATPIYNSIKKYCKKFSINVLFTVHCQIARKLPIEIALWFCACVGPTNCPNTPLNVLRSPFGRELYQLYTDLYKPEIDENLNELVNRWYVWNYFVANRSQKNLELEVRAQYQNYIQHKGQLILLSGSCEKPFPSPCGLVKPNIALGLLGKLTVTSKKIDQLDEASLDAPLNFVPDEHVDEEHVLGTIAHVKINPKTCRPLVMCPVTGLHWKVCAGQFSDSFLATFNRYCNKHDAYPESYLDLAAYHSRRHKFKLLTTANMKQLKYAYGLFAEVMSTHTCQEYIRLHKSFNEEEKRLMEE